MKKQYRKVIEDLGNEVKVIHKNNKEIILNKNGFNLTKNDWIEYEFRENKGKLDFSSLKILDMAKSISKIYGDNINYSTKNPDLFEQISKDVVKLFKFAGLTINKLRQYYQSIVNIYNAYDKKKEFDKNELKTELNFLLAKINYDVNRKGSKVPKEVYDFVNFHKNKVFENDNEKEIREKFKIFKKHFETVVAYAVGYLANR